MKIQELARLIQGQAQGGGDIDIMGLSGIDMAKAGDLTFAVDEDRLYGAGRSNASCALANKTIRRSSKALIRVTNPKLSFRVSCNAFNAPPDRESFIHPLASVAASVEMGRNVRMGSGVSIGGNVRIGGNSGVGGNVESGATIWGSPARPIAQTKRQTAILSRLAKSPKKGEDDGKN